MYANMMSNPIVYSQQVNIPSHLRRKLTQTGQWEVIHLAFRMQLGIGYDRQADDNAQIQKYASVFIRINYVGLYFM